MNKVSSATGIIVVLAAVVCGGCSSEKQAVPEPSTAFESNAPAAQPSPTSSVVTIDERIARACDLPTPRFAFDSAHVQETADPSLDKIAACFTTGPLAGRKLDLVGHADPRGDVDYNLGLGQRRAGNVAGYLERRGVQRERVSTSSRGAFDAVGTDERGWALDRRVDITLGD